MNPLLHDAEKASESAAKRAREAEVFRRRAVASRGFPRRRARVDSIPREGKHPLSLLWTDPHHPYEDPATWAVILRAIVDLDPDHLFVLGDVNDLACLASYDPISVQASLALECAATREKLLEANGALEEADRRYREGKPKKRTRIVLEGNHDWRFRKWLLGKCPEWLRDSVRTPEDQIGYADLGWTYLDREEQPLRVGNLLLHHGIYFGKHHAAKHAEELGSNVYGHTHRAQAFYVTTQREGTVQSVGLPAACELVRAWAHVKRVCNWTSGFGVIEWTGDVGVVYPVVLVRRGRSKTAVAAYGRHRWKVRA